MSQMKQFHMRHSREGTLMTEAERKRQDYRKTMMLTEPLPKVITRMAAPSII